MMIRSFSLVVGLLMAAGIGHRTEAQERKTRDQLVREDLATILAENYWIYNDLQAGLKRAAESGKPVLVVIRCIPCEACAQLDAEIVERDPVVQKLMSEFVCVRQVHANGLDLNLLQYDYDQSFAAFFLNADGTIYGRYGTRSHQTESADDVSLEGFAAALEGALAMHRRYPANQQQLAGKQPSKVPAYPVPEEYPSLRERFGAKLNYEGQVAQSCIHCHQVGEAQRAVYFSKGESLPDALVFPYPHPKALGLIMDPQERATIKAVTDGSVAERDGFRAGDELIEFGGQQPLSIADLQWVLHNAPETGSIDVKLLRSGAPQSLTLTLDEGWRHLDTISWRVSTWELRRMVFGGLVLEDLSDRERQDAGLEPQTLALRVKHVGQYGDHAAAKRAGFEQGDIVVQCGGQAERLRETDLIAQLLSKLEPGQSTPTVVLRDGRRMELELPMQR